MRSKDRAFRDQRSRAGAVTHLYCDCSRADVMTGSVEYSVSVAVGGAIADSSEGDGRGRFERGRFERARAAIRVDRDSSGARDGNRQPAGPSAITARCRPQCRDRARASQSRPWLRSARPRVPVGHRSGSKLAETTEVRWQSRLSRSREFVPPRCRPFQSMRLRPLAMSDCVSPSRASAATRSLARIWRNESGAWPEIACRRLARAVTLRSARDLVVSICPLVSPWSLP